MMRYLAQKKDTDGICTKINILPPFWREGWGRGEGIVLQPWYELISIAYNYNKVSFLMACIIHHFDRVCEYVFLISYVL